MIQKLAISFTVYGDAVPKQSTRFDGKGRAHTDPRVKAWQDMIAISARQEMFGIDPWAGDIGAEIAFMLPTERAGDIDNLCKCVLDGCNKIVYADDKQVMALHAVKHFGVKCPRINVRFWRMADDQAQ